MRPQTPRTHRTGGRRFLVRISSELKVLKVLAEGLLKVLPRFAYTHRNGFYILRMLVRSGVRLDRERPERQRQKERRRWGR